MTSAPAAMMAPVAAPVSEELLRTLGAAWCRKRGALPVAVGEGGVVEVLISAPLTAELQRELALLVGPTVVRLDSPSVVEAAINAAFEPLAAAQTLDGADEAQVAVQDLLDAQDEAPVIRFVNGLLTQAARSGASDVHIEPKPTLTEVRMRVDGVLQPPTTVPASAHSALVSRIKVQSGLDIAEKRLPQDGRFDVRLAGRDLDMRVSTLPCTHGERVVLRLLERSGDILTLDRLGLEALMAVALRDVAARPHGLFLVTGPTGSGKTTTLYALLGEVDRATRNVITVEDPVEYQLPGISQVQVNTRSGLSFAAGLRSILRQDPDVMLIGEIRDAETAEIAVKSALTGHLVLSTLHTNDAAGALPRLLDMGVEPYLAASCVCGVLAQRLVRRLCPSCSRAVPATEQARRLGLTVAQQWVPQGCTDCQGSGYRGRMGLFEMLLVDDELRGLISERRDASALRAAARRSGGLHLLLEDGLRAVASGATSLEEVLRASREEN